jgi:hypothetical protein
MRKESGLLAKSGRAFVSFNLGSFCYGWYIAPAKACWNASEEDKA